MKKGIITLIAIAFLLSACTNSAEKKETKNENEEVLTVEEIVPVNVITFEEQAEELVGKKVVITGTVDHVCEHGGQRMFIIETGSDARVKVTPDEQVAAFKPDWEGQNIELTGIVEEQRIDEDYLKEWEEEIMADADMGDDKGEGKHLGGNMEKGGSEADKAEEMEKVNNLRQQIAETEKGYLSFFSILCTDYKVIDTDTEETEETEGEE
jgi:hypothetical protein